MTGWTQVPKPTEASVSSSSITALEDASPIGMLLAITSVVADSASVMTSSSIVTGWTAVSKPAD